MEDEYWKKRYEKALGIIECEFGVYGKELVEEQVEEEIEEEEIGMEGTVEDAKVRKVTRHDTP